MEGEQRKSRADAAGGLMFVGAVMIGIGAGLFAGSVAVGTLIGLGVGFILFGLTKALVT